MGNPHKGEVTFEAGGVTYTMKLQFYELAVLERITRVTAPKFLNRPGEDWGADDLLAVMRAALSRSHKLTEEAVADLIDAIGFAKVAELVGEVIAVSTFSGGESKQDARPTVTESRTSSTGMIS